MKDHTYTPNVPDPIGWKRRHLEAMAEPCGTLRSAKAASHESAMALMVRGWCEYAQSHKDRFGSEIGDDQMLGDEWMAIGRAMLGLLNGVLGRLDGGTLDAIIRDNLTDQGFDPDSGERKRDGKS